jgi:hypothetical protein
MRSQTFEVIRGLVTELQVRQDEEDFVFSGGDKVMGGVTAAGLALGGLAGAATGAALSTSDAAERVDFFVCMVGGRAVKGRFGKVSFADGDAVEVVGSVSKEVLDAFAVVRPGDRTVWMHPHCGRGSATYKAYCTRAISLASLFVPAVFVVPLMTYGQIRIGNPIPIWFWLLNFLLLALLVAAVLAFVASRFNKFARLSDDIFAALSFDNPCDVDLPKTLRKASKSFTSLEGMNFHPYARWVYKY